MKNPYPREAFSRAIYSMVVSPKSLQERLHDAYAFHLSYLQPDDIPEHVKSRFNSLMDHICDPTKLSEEDAIEKAMTLLSISDAIDADYFGR